MIDCPWDTTQLQPLLDSIQARHHKKVILHIATHSHEDRSAGLDFYAKQGIATYPPVQTNRILQQHNKNRAANLIQKDTTFKAGPYSFQIFIPDPDIPATILLFGLVNRKFYTAVAL